MKLPDRMLSHRRQLILLETYPGHYYPGSTFLGKVVTHVVTKL